MKKLLSILLLGGALLSLPSFGYAQECVTTKDIDRPFPLGMKAPIPWNDIDGYWTDYGGKKYFYRIEVKEVFPNGSRSISVQILDSNGVQIVGTGAGFVRANAWDLWARVKGLNLDLKIRVQAYFPEGDNDLNKRVLVASIKDLRADANKCLVRHALRKVDTLESSRHAKAGKK